MHDGMETETGRLVATYEELVHAVVPQKNIYVYMYVESGVIDT